MVVWIYWFQDYAPSTLPLQCMYVSFCVNIQNCIEIVTLHSNQKQKIKMQFISHIIYKRGHGWQDCETRFCFPVVLSSVPPHDTFGMSLLLCPFPDHIFLNESNNWRMHGCTSYAGICIFLNVYLCLFLSSAISLPVVVCWHHSIAVVQEKKPLE